jgi:hypothetical protein
MKKRTQCLLIGSALSVAACTPTMLERPVPQIAEMTEESLAADSKVDQQMAHVALQYIHITLEAGTHEAEWVDAYYGDDDLQSLAIKSPRSKESLLSEINALINLLDTEVLQKEYRNDVQQRARAMRGMLVAADTRMRMLSGQKFAFDDEAKGQFATVPQLKTLAHYDTILARLEKEIPGTGPLATRVDAFNERFVIPKERLKPVFDAAIGECRKRTAEHIALPADESFVMEFVTGKPWSGYNYYQGKYKSLIQINTDLPIRISRAVDLGCHEGYPGHHVLNLMIENKLYRGKGWEEFSVNPLYSPQSVISEGSANYGIDLAFSPAERLQFERDVLYPLAGLDPKTAEAFWNLQQATEALSGARLTIAKLYLDGEIDRPKALALTEKYLLVSPERAAQSVGFTDHYRSYVINYGWGKELVKGYVERGNPDKNERWQRMEKILSEPVLPDDLMR